MNKAAKFKEKKRSPGRPVGAIAKSGKQYDKEQGELRNEKKRN